MLYLRCKAADVAAVGRRRWRRLPAANDDKLRMGDDAKSRLLRRLQRYRQHHEASRNRYDNHMNNISEQQRELTRLLHKRWLESQCSNGSRKRLKLAVVEGTPASSDTHVNCSTTESLVRISFLVNVHLYHTCSTMRRRTRILTLTSTQP